MKKVISILFVLCFMLCLTSCGTKEVENTEISCLYCIPGNEETEIHGTYTGTLEKGKPAGAGTFTADQESGSWSYTGEFVDGKMTGNGTVNNLIMNLTISNISSNEGAYSGKIQGFIPDGNGIFIVDADNSWSYSGNFSNGAPSGAGVFENVPIEIVVNNSKDRRQGTYSGDVLDGMPDGEGVFTAVNSEGVRYTHTGSFKNGTFNGYGESIFDSDDAMPFYGNFTDGAFDPTLPELAIWLGKADIFGKYELSDQAKAFIEEYEYLFPVSSPDEIPNDIIGEYSYKAYAKSMKDRSDSIVSFKATIIQIFEYEVGSYTISMMLVYDSDYNPSVVFYPSSVDVYDGDVIRVYGLPIASTSFNNTAGGQTNVIVFLGSYVY